MLLLNTKTIPALVNANLQLINQTEDVLNALQILKNAPSVIWVIP